MERWLCCCLPQRAAAELEEERQASLLANGQTSSSRPQSSLALQPPHQQDVGDCRAEVGSGGLAERGDLRAHAPRVLSDHRTSTTGSPPSLRAGGAEAIQAQPPAGRAAHAAAAQPACAPCCAAAAAGCVSVITHQRAHPVPSGAGPAAQHDSECCVAPGIHVALVWGARGGGHCKCPTLRRGAEGGSLARWQPCPAAPTRLPRRAPCPLSPSCCRSCSSCTTLVLFC
jgi:hypothetical protein